MKGYDKFPATAHQIHQDLTPLYESFIKVNDLFVRSTRTISAFAEAVRVGASSTESFAIGSHLTIEVTAPLLDLVCNLVSVSELLRRIEQRDVVIGLRACAFKLTRNSEDRDYHRYAGPRRRLQHCSTLC